MSTCVPHRCHRHGCQFRQRDRCRRAQPPLGVDWRTHSVHHRRYLRRHHLYPLLRQHAPPPLYRHPRRLPPHRLYRRRRPPRKAPFLPKLCPPPRQNPHYPHDAPSGPPLRHHRHLHHKDPLLLLLRRRRQAHLLRDQSRLGPFHRPLRSPLLLLPRLPRPLAARPPHLVPLSHQGPAIGVRGRQHHPRGSIARHQEPCAAAAALPSPPAGAHSPQGPRHPTARATQHHAPRPSAEAQPLHAVEHRFLRLLHRVQRHPLHVRLPATGAASPAPAAMPIAQGGHPLAHAAHPWISCRRRRRRQGSGECGLAD